MKVVLYNSIGSIAESFETDKIFAAKDNVIFSNVTLSYSPYEELWFVYRDGRYSNRITTWDVVN